MPELTLIMGATVGMPLCHMTDPKVTMVLQGQMRVLLGREYRTSGSGQYVVTSTDIPSTSYVADASRETPFVAIAIQINQRLITEVLSEAGEKDWTTLNHPSISVSESDAEFVDVMSRLYRILEAPYDQPMLASLTQKELIWRLLLGEQGPLVRHIGLTNSALSRVGRAVQWIRSHYADKLRSEEIARVACLSVSSLNRHFRKVTGMTPIEYQKRIRLQHARTRLIQNDASIASVSEEVGYESPSQFSREYRRAFGVPPSEDTIRMKQDSAQPDDVVADDAETAYRAGFPPTISGPVEPEKISTRCSCEKFGYGVCMSIARSTHEGVSL